MCYLICRIQFKAFLIKMRELKDEEEQWLKVFAQDNDFFHSLLEFYERNNYLTDKQYYCLVRDIDKAEEEGDTILDKEELRFLKDIAEQNYDLKELLEIYEDNGFLDEYEYRQFINLKNQYTRKEQDDKDFKLGEINEPQIIKRVDERDPNKTIIRIPCPHCSSLCSPQVKFCAKCGEPLT